MGIDGRVYPVGTKPTKEGSKKTKTGETGPGMFAGDWFPIQVKQAEKVGRPDIDQFEAVMEREDRGRGFFVAFGYSSDAERECNGFHKRSGRIIKLLTVQAHRRYPLIWMRSTCRRCEAMNRAIRGNCGEPVYERDLDWRRRLSPRHLRKRSRS